MDTAMIKTPEDNAMAAAEKAATLYAAANDAAMEAAALGEFAASEAADPDGLADACGATAHAMQERTSTAWLAAARKWKLAPRGR